MKKYFQKHKIWVPIIVLTIVGLSVYSGLSAIFSKDVNQKLNIGIEFAAKVKRVEPLPNTKNIFLKKLNC